MINTNATEPSAKADFTVGGISGRFRTLTMLEWKYIFNGKNDRSRTASVCGITGKVVAPDDFSGTLADSYGRRPCIIYSMICGCFAIPEARIQP